MEKEIIIRPYTPEDKSAVLRLIRLNTPKYFSKEEEKELDHYLENEIEEYFVIQFDQIVVGCGGINFEEDKTIGIISWDIIHPEYQGKSLGGQLLQYRIDRLKNEDPIRMIIVRTSQLTHLFYENFGFKLTEVIEDYWAKGYHLYKMEYSK